MLQKKKTVKCDGSCDNEKHGMPVYMCPQCNQMFCKKCNKEYCGECPFCEPPSLVPINKSHKI